MARRPRPPSGGEPFDRAALARYLKSLEREDGQILEDDVIDDARDPGSPLHPHFNWNVQEAAMEHWRQQARLLIRQVKFEVTVYRVPIKAPRYVKDFKHQTGYRDVVRVRTEEDTARETFVAELLRVRAAVRRAKNTAIALGLGDQIVAIDELVTGLCRRVDIDDQPQGTA